MAFSKFHIEPQYRVPRKRVRTSSSYLKIGCVGKALAATVFWLTQSSQDGCTRSAVSKREQANSRNTKNACLFEGLY